MPIDCCWFAVIALRPQWGSVQLTRDQISKAHVSQSWRRDQTDVCLWVYDCTEQKKLRLIRSRTCTTSKHANRVSQQDTELSREGELPCWCSTGHSLFWLLLLWSCWHSGNGTLSSLPFYRWLLTGSSAFLSAERSLSVIFPRSYCYGMRARLSSQKIEAMELVRSGAIGVL